MSELAILEGGPTQRLLVRIGIMGKRLPGLARGGFVLGVVAWLPLLFFSWRDGLLFDGTPLPFLYDFGAHVRLLFATPLLIAAEAVIGPQIGGAAAQLLQRGLVRPADHERYEAAVGEAMRVRDSAVLETAVLVFAYVGAFFAMSLEVTADHASWALVPHGRLTRLTQAGIWNTFVAVPVFQFLVFRWFVRLLNWWNFLGRIARLDLALMPTHPDRAGGLAFMGAAHRSLGLIAFALGSVLSARYCADILYQGTSLAAFRIPVATFAGLMALLFLGPLLVFVPRLAMARRRELGAFGRLAYRYSSDFDQKWVSGAAPADEPLLGTGDIQSLADIGASYQRIQEMRPIPFGPREITILLASALLPMAPILTTQMPLEQVVETLLKLLG